MIVTLVTRPEPEHKQRGLVWGTIADAIRHYKGSPGDESGTTRAVAGPRRAGAERPPAGDAALPVVDLGRRLAARLGAGAGDLVYVSDRRWWLGGRRSAHAIVGTTDGTGDDAIKLGRRPSTWSWRPGGRARCSWSNGCTENRKPRATRSIPRVPRRSVPSSAR